MDIRLTLSLRRFVDRQIKTGRYKDSADVVRAALQQMSAMDGLAGSPGDLAALAGLSGSEDIEAMVFMVMMEAVKSAQDDLKAIMAEVKAMTNAKAQLRNLINKVNRDVAANASCDDSERNLDFSRGLGSEQAYHRAPMPLADPEAPDGVRFKPCDLRRGKFSQVKELQAILDDLKSRLDSLNEMSEMSSLRLQMAMDRRSKFISTLSNIMKQISSTEDTLVQNLK